MKKLQLFASFVLIALVFAGCATSSTAAGGKTPINVMVDDVPLPSDLQIVQPDSVTVPAKLAGFSGKWEGRWDQTLDHVLVVEEIRGNAAMVVYAWGRAPSWFIDPGWGRTKGQFKGDELILNLPNGAIVTYRMKNGVLASEYDRGRYFARATMKRVE